MQAYTSSSYTVPWWKHSYPMEKYRLVPERLLAEGTLLPQELITPKPTTREEILRAHQAEYVRAVVNGTLGKQALRRIGLPWSPALVRRGLAVIGGTLSAARAALRDGAAVNLGGGTHHAFADRGAGYCVFNDLVIALRHLRAVGLARRVLIIDLDVHQGDGSAALCRDDPDAFTFSVHGEKNFPGKKETSSRDIPLPAGADDDFYLDQLSQALSLLPDRFAPDLILYQAGVDVLAEDRFGTLALTMAGIAERDRLVCEFARAGGWPLCVTLGGGYSPDIEQIVEAHCATVRAARRVLDGSSELVRAK
jgi:acetoin utilization deacetylase AcuC-like enzyme